EPAFIPTVLVDKICGLYTAFGIVSALLSRERGGQGGALESPMFESMVSFLMAEHLGGHVFEPPLGPLRYQRVMSPYRRPYRTADGHIAVLPYVTKHWQGFLKLVGRDDLAAAEWLSDASERSERVGELYEVLAEVMPSRTTAEWLHALKALDIPCSPVNRLEALLDDPHLRSVGFFRRTEHPTEGRLNSLRHPLRFVGAEEYPDLPAPVLGGQGGDVLREHGFNAEEIESLIDAGVVCQPTPDGAG
ncbi:MAG: CoA transferase, partial [Ectothiorhodospiraceae bacterium]|nr:CoA transferase [Ectothiorhodospiraceae bacterium]